LLARVRHPNVMTVFGADRVGDEVGVWMEFARSQTLEEVLRDSGPLDVAQAAAIGVELAGALSAIIALEFFTVTSKRTMSFATQTVASSSRILAQDMS
jgi:hypothetical protein